jgi:hypothetical protein
MRTLNIRGMIARNWNSCKLETHFDFDFDMEEREGEGLH